MNIWAGEFGTRYFERNPITPEIVRAREKLWGQILNAMLPARPVSIMEVGAGEGVNLRVLHQLLRPPQHKVFAIEANGGARERLFASHVAGSVLGPEDFESFDDDTVDLVFTSGCLIHIHPDNLLDMCREIHRCSSRWIVAIEYFSSQPREIEYRGEMGRLWTRDFGKFYLDNFPGLSPIGCGFAWSRMTGLDDLTYWVFEKR